MVTEKIKSQNQSRWNNKTLPFPFNNRGEVVVAPESKYKIKVDGQEKEVSVTNEQIVEALQKNEKWTQEMQKLSKDKETLKAEEARVAGMKVIVDEMDSDPKLKETLNKVYSDYKSGKIAKSVDNKDSNLKKLDKLIEEASDPGEREKLRDIREIIKEEAPLADTASLKEMIGSLKEEIATLRSTQNIGQTERVEVQIAKLEEKFGADLIDKYRVDIKAMALKYPNQTVSKILYHFADDSEIEAAILSGSKKKDKEELERKKFNSFPGGQDNFFTAKTPLQKDKTGRITMESLRSRILERLGKR